MTIDNAAEPAPLRGSRAGVSRRTLVVGTAWAVPAVVVATAAPAVAASTPCPAGATVSISSGSCYTATGPGQYVYTLYFCATTPGCTGGASIDISQFIVINFSDNQGVGAVGRDVPTIVVPAGSTTACLANPVIIQSDRRGDYVQVSYSVGGTTGQANPAAPGNTCPA